MYVITSICAFAMYKAELISAEQSSVGLLSTLVYCVLITLSILPLYTTLFEYEVGVVTIFKSLFAWAMRQTYAARFRDTKK